MKEVILSLPPNQEPDDGFRQRVKDRIENSFEASKAISVGLERPDKPGVTAVSVQEVFPMFSLAGKKVNLMSMEER